MLARKGGPSIQAFRQEGIVFKKTHISRTCCGRANASSRVNKHVKFDIKHRFFEATGEHVPSEADHLLRPSEGVDYIIDLWAQTRVAQYGEFVDPRVVDLTGVTNPVYRILGVVRIRDDGGNHTNLKGQKKYVTIGLPMTSFDAKSVRLAKQLTSAPASGPVVS